MSNGSFQTANPRFTALLAAILGLFGAVYLGRAIGEGDHGKIYLALVAGVGGAVTLALGKKYWLMGPLAMCLSIPLIPMGQRSFELAEVGCAFVFGMYVVMVALHRNTLHLGKRENAGIYLFMGLVGLIFALHPVGLLFFGSSSFGARFYIKIILAFFIYLALSSQEVTEKDTKWIIRFYLFGAFVSCLWGLFDYFVLGNTGGVDDDGGFYTWHQILAGPPFAVAVWMFARYRPSTILSFQKVFLLGMYLAAIFVAFMSGKRAMVASILMIPAIASVIVRQYRYATIGLILVGIFATLVVIGQGNVFELPLSAQRALMYLPAHWDAEISAMKDRGSIDEFRTKMRELAWDKAMENPWLGEGFAIDIEDTAGMGNMSMAQDPTALLAVGKAWHSFWLALAADLGFFAWPIYALIYFTAITTALWILKRTKTGTPYHTYAMICLIGILINLAKSYTSGQTALTPFGEWYVFGLLVAIKYTMMSKAKEMAAEEKLSATQPSPLTNIPPVVSPTPS